MATDNGFSVYTKRAKVKYIQAPLIDALISVDSKLKPQYLQTKFCSQNIKQEGNTFTTLYCGKRWCRICNRIRTAKLMNGYKSEIKAMREPVFLTLTFPNVKADDLKPAIRQMIKDFRLITDLRRKQGKPKIKGIRKLECTYNPTRNDYHPHYHFIIDGQENAEYIRREWLLRWPEAVEEAQDIRPAKDPIELFKYFSKLTSKTGAGAKAEAAFPFQLDIIFQAIQGFRIIQPFGGLKMVNDEVDQLESIEIEEAEPQQAMYKWHFNNWVNFDTGEMLSNFQPTAKNEKYRKKIIFVPLRT